MATQEAKDNIGKPFKIQGGGNGIFGSFDVIRSVNDAGEIIGDFMEAPAEDCVLKQEQPEQLKKTKNQLS